MEDHSKIKAEDFVIVKTPFLVSLTKDGKVYKTKLNKNHFWRKLAFVVRVNRYTYTVILREADPDGKEVTMLIDKKFVRRSLEQDLSWF